MGCSSERCFEDEVRKEIFAYINTLNAPPPKKNELKSVINDDLLKKSAAFKSYKYSFKDEDKEKVVSDYKKLIEGRK